MLTAVAMGKETGKLTNESLLVKTEKRFKRSVQFSQRMLMLWQFFLLTSLKDRCHPTCHSFKFTSLIHEQLKLLNGQRSPWRPTMSIRWTLIWLDLVRIQPVLPLKECRAGPEIWYERLLMTSTTTLRYAATSRRKAKTKCPEDSGYGSPLFFQQAVCRLLPTSRSVV